MQLLIEDGQEVHCFVYDKRRQFDGWERLQIVEQPSIEETSDHQFDFVFFSNAFLIPMFLPYVGNAQPVLLCMAYESFHYGKTFDQAMTDKQSITSILKLPISIMAVSEGVRNLLKERIGVDSYYVPHGIEPHFHARPAVPFSRTPKRILMVGSYLSPWKGMTAGFDAIEKLSRELEVKLVLMTQPTISRNIFDKYTFPIEFHCRPELNQVPEIYASCHVHLCCSWHEGTGMPTLECMNEGVPVIATNNDGTVEFARDRENILFVEKNNSQDMFEKLKEFFSAPDLAAHMRGKGIEAMKFYSWENCFALFKKAQQEISAMPRKPVVSVVEMKNLLIDLELEGLFTPLETYRKLTLLDRDLHTLCEQLVQRELSVQSAVSTLSGIKEALTPYVQNERTEYYNSFRAPYDLCRLLLSLKDEPSFVDYAASIAAQRKTAR
ncbi:MAG TPA: glycosyltransferase family 4 protein [Drouetiella sp.]